jgi:RNA polymerase sigma factor (sigma-70 family)
MSSINLLDENLLLWNKFRNGDVDAFGELMRIHYQDLFNYGTRIAKDEELAKDCIQDLFLSLWEKRLTVNETSFVKYYLLKSLRRRIIKAIDKKRHSHAGKEFRMALIFNSEDHLDNKVILQENLSDLTYRMRKVLANLSARQQEVIYFRFYLDADIEEIAEIMELSRQSVYNLLHSSLKKLKKLSSNGAFSLSHFFGALPLFI